MKYCDIDFNDKTILITGGAGFIGSNLAFYFQENFPEAKVVVFDRFVSEETFSNGNLKSFGHFKNLIGFNGEVISGNITSKKDLERLKKNITLYYSIQESMTLENLFKIFDISILIFSPETFVKTKTLSLLIHLSNEIIFLNFHTQLIISN